MLAGNMSHCWGALYRLTDQFSHSSGSLPESLCLVLQVRGFWAQLEAATNERQQAMFRMLNVHLARLAQRVETVVGDLLEVSAPPPMHRRPDMCRRCVTEALAS